MYLQKNVGSVFGRIYLVQVKHHQPVSLSSYLYILLFTLTLFDKSDIIKDEKDRDGGGVNKRGHGLPRKINAEKDNSEQVVKEHNKVRKHGHGDNGRQPRGAHFDALCAEEIQQQQNRGSEQQRKTACHTEQ